MECIVKDCKNTNIVAKSLCSKHYHRQHRYNNVYFVKQNKDQQHICILDNCNNKSLAKNLCQGHYARWKRDKENFDKSPLRKNTYYSNNDICIIPHCINKPHAKKMCKGHYSQQSKHDIDFSKIISYFENGCQICGATKNLCIDHDHAICSGKRVCEKCFRGVLCSSCNSALGLLKENKNTLENMIEYLENNNTIKLINK